MTNLRRVILFTASLMVAFVCEGQPPHNEALKSLAFLSGRWVRNNGAEVQEENWSPVSGNSMIGSFRIVANGKPIFYEFWAVEVDGKQPVLKLKHFNADLAGWEEKNSSSKMPLDSDSEDDAVFAASDGSVSLHYHRTGDTLTCIVHHVRNGKGSDETFDLTRVQER